MFEDIIKSMFKGSAIAILVTLILLAIFGPVLIMIALLLGVAKAVAGHE